MASYYVEVANLKSSNSTVDVYANNAVGVSGVIVSPADTLVFDSTFTIGDIDENAPGSIQYIINDSSHLKIRMPATADATNGDHIIYTGVGGAQFNIIIQIGGTPPTITGPWTAAPAENNPWIYVILPGGNTAVQNNQLLYDTLIANAQFYDNDFSPQIAVFDAGTPTPETSTSLMLRKLSDIVFLSIKGFSIASFSATDEGLKISEAVPVPFRPSSNTDEIASFPVRLWGDGTIYTGLMTVDASDGSIYIYPIDQDSGFGSGDEITFGDINVSYLTSDYPA